MYYISRYISTLRAHLHSAKTLSKKTGATWSRGANGKTACVCFCVISSRKVGEFCRPGSRCSWYRPDDRFPRQLAHSSVVHGSYSFGVFLFANKPFSSLLLAVVAAGASTCRTAKFPYKSNLYSILQLKWYGSSCDRCKTFYLDQQPSRICVAPLHYLIHGSPFSST